MVCDILFNICKCTNHECRLFMASQLPVLLWTEWVLEREQPSLEEDRSAIEIALLAAFQQDLNIEASTPQTRIPDVRGEPSIYHAKEAGASFPMRETPAERVIKPDPCMYPSRPVTKLDHYSRSIVLYRLCRLLQDNLPSLPCSTKVAYCLFMERMATIGTKLADTTATDCLQQLALNLTAPYDAVDNPSMLSLLHFDTKPKDNTLETSPRPALRNDVGKIDFDAITALFDSSRFTSAPRRFPASVPIYLLWADALACFSFTFTNLSKIVQKQLLRRARYEGLPVVILALS